ncbi:hypothetical protein MANES_15G082300v8 [Manihot esculenta]|uniref:Uncharacterized protein n=1 Tax=Manihot esculenta TaxID=3983 RepID=A0A2C9UE07_MANES|nr:hypothetical protein MANES_15G082300v8 [Manihot esculenta]
MSSNRGVCKLEVAFKQMEQRRNIGWVAESAAPNNNNSSTLGGSAVNNQVTRIDERVRKRVEEKAETLMHLIIWGPN